MSGVMLTKENGGVQFFQHNRIVHGLGLEVNTGMKVSRGVSMVKVAQANGMIGETTRAKKKALKEAVKFMKENYPTWEVSPSIQKALDS